MNFLFFVGHFLLLSFVVYVIISEHNWKDLSILRLVASAFFSFLILISILGLRGHIKTLISYKDIRNK
jgi:hypothetical protein